MRLNLFLFRRGLLATALALAVISYPRPRVHRIPRPDDPDLLLITIDTLRADRLGVYGSTRGVTPNLDALAGTGLLFTRAYTPVPLTLPAHLTLMTGRFPDSHGVHLNGQRATTALPGLAARLADQGYLTRAHVSSAVLARGSGIEAGFQLYDDAVNGPGELVRDGAKTLQAALADLDAADRSRPLFMWVHFYDLHHHDRLDTPGEDAAYVDELRRVDGFTGTLIREFQARARPRLMIVAGDHGEMLGEHGEPGHGYFLYESAMRVPLLLVGAGIPRGRQDALVSLADIHPTIERLLRLPHLVTLPGRPLTDLLSEAVEPGRVLPEETQYPRDAYGLAPLRGARSRDFHFVFAPRRELYDLKRDPGELHNLLAGEAAPLPAALPFALLERAAAPVAVERQENAAMRDFLALGYLSANYARPGVRDPKDAVAILDLFYRGRRLCAEEKFSEAIPLFQRAIRLAPEGVNGPAMLGEAYLRLGRVADAHRVYQDGLFYNPDNWFLRRKLAESTPPSA